MGQSILIVDKNLKDLMRIADRHYIIENSSIVWSGTSGDLQGNRQQLDRYLGI